MTDSSAPFVDYVRSCWAAPIALFLPDLRERQVSKGSSSFP